MQAPSARAVHLSEWQRNHFTTTSGACTPGQKADAYRAQILRIQYAQANSEISQACASRLFKRYADKYSAIVDSDNAETGLNNYAENVLTLARPQQTDSEQWRSGLSVTSVFQMSSVQEMMRAGAESRDSLLAAAGASVVIHKGAAAFGPPKFGVPGGSGEGDPVTPPARGADRTRDIPEGGVLGPGNAHPPVVTDTPKACPPLSAPLGDSAPAKSHATPLFGGARQENSSSPKASVGLNMFLPSRAGCPAASDGPRERLALYGPADALRAPLLNRALGKTEDDGQGEESGLPTFKTAKEQLWAEQQSKHRPPAHASGSSYGGVKKSLGTSRSRGIFGKFVPPVPKPEGGDPGGGLQCKPDGAGAAGPAPLADERLRGLEPKMVELIMSEIVDRGPPVHWEDIAGGRVRQSHHTGDRGVAHDAARHLHRAAGAA